MPFLIKTRECIEHPLHDDFKYFYVDTLISIPKKKFFNFNSSPTLKKEIVLSTEITEAKVFDTLLLAQETVDRLRRINSDYPYRIDEVSVEVESK